MITASPRIPYQPEGIRVGGGGINWNKCEGVRNNERCIVFLRWLFKYHLRLSDINILILISIKVRIAQLVQRRAKGWASEKPGFDSRQGTQAVSLCRVTKQALRLNQTSIQTVLRALSAAGQWSSCRSNEHVNRYLHLPASLCDVVRRHRDNFTSYRSMH